MPDAPEETAPIDPKEFDRQMNAKVLRYGSRQDRACPRCHDNGYRRVADSEMVALYACRLCGFQQQVLHETQTEVDHPFREYREGRGFQAAVEDESPPAGAPEE
jgi:predicted RNA-binding Zn-ribbon protein involved in translation (DUF1610 family)